MSDTLIVTLRPMVERGHAYRTTPAGWPGTPQYRSDWREARPNPYWWEAWTGRCKHWREDRQCNRESGHDGEHAFWAIA